MNDALSAIGASSSEQSATAQALQQALLGQTPEGSAQPSAVPADTEPSPATPIADTTPDAPSLLMALTARTQAPRRGAGPEHAEPATATAALPQDTAITEPRLIAAPVSAATQTTASLLTTPALLTALQAGQTQQLWSHFPQTQAEERRAARQQDGHAGSDPHTTQDEDDANGKEGPVSPEAIVTANGTPRTWQERLSSDLRRRTPTAPAAALLKLAFAQWQRGRTVLIVSPRDAAGAERGWLHALRWASGDALVAGERFEARLRWRGPQPAEHWWGVRATKQQGLHLGRQLRAQAELPEVDATEARAQGVSLELHLGPGNDDASRAGVIDVQVDTIARLWASLERQWSVVVIACNHPLGVGEP